MGHSFSSFQILNLTFLLFLFMVLRTYKKPKTKQKLPPGPWRLPIVGNIHQLLGSLPHRCLTDLAKKHGPIMQLQLGEVPHVVVSSPEAAMEVMKTHDITLAQRPVSLVASIITYNNRDIAFAPYGEYWRQLRKVCTVELFSTKRVQSFRSIREEEVSSMVTSILAASSSSSSQPLNLREMFLYLTSSITCRAAFGKTSERQSAILMSLMKRITEVFSGFTVADFFPSIRMLHEIGGVKTEVMKLHRDIDALLQSIVDEHMARKDKVGCGGTKEADNLLDVLLSLHDGGDLGFQLTTDDVKAIVYDVFTAGMETSATTMEWLMSEVLKNPSTMKKVQDELRHAFGGKEHVNETSLHELKYLSAVIKETLRLHPALPLLLPREARETLNINGYEITKKTIVLVNAWAIGRDPNYWSEAERFYPERFLDSSIDYKGLNFEFIPFGAGRRICAGMLFATSSIEIALANLLYHFDWKLPNGAKPEDLDMSESFGIVGRKKYPLQLFAVPYYPPPKN